jgi:signal transduction histidine kinase
MNTPIDILTRGIHFVRSNPQIIYTLFLVVAIPLAFFFTSEQFLKVARDNQDRLERSRIGLLQDSFALFAGGYMGDVAYLESQMRTIAKNNETMVTFDLLGPPVDGAYPILASLDDNVASTTVTFDPLSSALISATVGDPQHQSYAAEFFSGGSRYWRSARAIVATDTGAVLGVIITDLSMAEADIVSRGNIQKAYLVLLVIIVLIIVLLGRQARIIDYATLYAKLKDIDKMKDDFVSMAAHELRSPLTIIRGYTEMIGETEKLTDKGKTQLRNIDHAATQLNTLIGDILDVAKLQEGRMSFRFESVDVSAQIASIVDSFMRPASDKGLTLTYEPKALPHIEVDPDRFRQVMVNFIGNAIKYTPSGSVTVSTNVEDGQLFIRISDTGMGISAEDQKKLFEKFYRVKNKETEKITGTGLGLWITHQIVRAMKGTISVESIRGKGTDFIVSFPLKK